VKDSRNVRNWFEGVWQFPGVSHERIGAIFGT
jgi:hypothetical protein